MYSIPVRTVWTFFTSPLMQCPAYMLPEGGVFPARDEHGQILFGRGQHPAVFRVDLVGLLQLAGAQNLEHKFMREKALAGFVGGDPFFEDDGFDAAHGFHFWNAGVGDAVHVAVEQVGFVLRGEVAVVRHALVEVVGDEVEDVFFEIRAGAADAVDLVLADHFGQRDTEFGGAHGAGKGDEHFAAGGEKLVVA